MRTIPLPKYITADCAAGPAPRLTVFDDGRHIIHPEHYNPAKIDAEDLVHDCCIRLLNGAEVALFESDGFGPGTLDVLLAAETADLGAVCDAIEAIADGAAGDQVGFSSRGDVVMSRRTLAALVRALRGGAQ